MTRRPRPGAVMPFEAHATTSGYVYWRCRCTRCRRFWTDYRAGRRAAGTDRPPEPRPLSLSIRVRGLPDSSEWSDPTFDFVWARLRWQARWREYLAACAVLEFEAAS